MRKHYLILAFFVLPMASSLGQAAHPINRKSILSQTQDIIVNSKDKAAVDSARFLAESLQPINWFVPAANGARGPFGRVQHENWRAQYEGSVVQGGRQLVVLGGRTFDVSTLPVRERKLISGIEAAIRRLNQDLAVMKKTRDLESDNVKVAVIQRTTEVTLNIPGNPREVLRPREEYPLVRNLGNYAIIKVAGQQTSIRTSNIKIETRAASNNIFSNTGGSTGGLRGHGGTTTALKPPVWERRLDADWTAVIHNGGLAFQITSVIGGGVGESMGLKVGDKIIKVNDNSIRSENELKTHVRSVSPPTFVVVDTAGRQRRLTFGATRKSVTVSGINGRPVNGEFTISFTSGNDPVLRQLRLQRNDKVLAVNGSAVQSLSDINKALLRNKGGRSEWIVLRQGQRRTESLTVTH